MEPYTLMAFVVLIAIAVCGAAYFTIQYVARQLTGHDMLPDDTRPEMSDAVRRALKLDHRRQEEARITAIMHRLHATRRKPGQWLSPNARATWARFQRRLRRRAAERRVRHG